MRLVLVEPVLVHGPEADDAAESLTRDNAGRVLEALESSAVACERDDVLVLPERFHLGSDKQKYLADVVRIARAAGCHVIGGSHHEAREGGPVNAGVAVAPDGSVIGSYEKVRPYAAERQWVRPGTHAGAITISGRIVLVLVCADFWYVDLVLREAEAPDLIVVPALSVSRKPAPDYSRALWRHLSVSRAYELGAFVGVSDWAVDSELPALRSSGVAGFADPTELDPERFFRPVAPARARAFTLDFAALSAFRADRTERGFFWKDEA
jgi:predicted amidohydrolase